MPSTRLPDALYRRLVKARAIMVLGDGTIYTFSRAVREIDESAAVQDQRNMTVRVVTSRRQATGTGRYHRGVAAHGGRSDNIC